MSRRVSRAEEDSGLSKCPTLGLVQASTIMVKYLPVMQKFQLLFVCDDDDDDGGCLHGHRCYAQM